jgi:hypothetical protein
MAYQQQHDRRHLRPHPPPRPTREPGMMSHPPARSTTADTFLGLPLVPYSCLHAHRHTSPPLQRTHAHSHTHGPDIPPQSRAMHPLIQQFSAVEHDPAPSPAPTHSLDRAHAARRVDEPSACVSGQR